MNAAVNLSTLGWSDAKALRAQVQKWWDKGELLALAVSGGTFPRRLVCKGPDSNALGEQFEAVRQWIATLQGLPHYRLEWREFRHRVLGNNRVPHEIWIDTLDDALAVIGMRHEWQRFAALVENTCHQYPAWQPILLPWMEKRALRVMGLSPSSSAYLSASSSASLSPNLQEDWLRLLAVVAWLAQHPRPLVYLRQVDVPGVDSKFIENHRTLLAELFDLLLPTTALDESAGAGTTSSSQFARRYGFLDKPQMVRCRLPQSWLPLVSTPSTPSYRNVPDVDMSLDARHFAHLAITPACVVITENEINYLAFPHLPNGVVIFGAGYGFDALRKVPWLRPCPVWYWGDIDTHGFAILDQLRSVLPHVQSLLMNRATLMRHQALWGQETQPTMRDLVRLNEEESALYDDLRDHRFGPAVRLEQERIGYDWVILAVEEIGILMKHKLL